jgi:hypothetical protein
MQFKQKVFNPFHFPIYLSKSKKIYEGSIYFFLAERGLANVSALDLDPD